MSNLLNVGTRALLANQSALQTTGNNIANVNTVGYSRQNVVLQTAGSQYSGSGYIGKGVDVLTIERAHSEFLTKQTAVASSIMSSDVARANKLYQLEDIFPTGQNGLGAAINSTLNSFSDVAIAPTDLTARSVALSRSGEMAARFRTASARIDDLQAGVKEELNGSVTTINSLAASIADLNDQIARSKGSGHVPNDLLDQREQRIKELNEQVQATTVPVEDGTVTVFIGSQPLVLGDRAATVKLVADPSGDPGKIKLALVRGVSTQIIDEQVLGGGAIAGVLRFQNNDLDQARTDLGRMALSITTSINTQHKLGLDLNGVPGLDFFKPIVSTAIGAATNAVGPPQGKVTVAGSDASLMKASDYEVTVTSGTSLQITRLSDGLVQNFTGLVPDGAGARSATMDGLTFKADVNSATNDEFLSKPYKDAAAQMALLIVAPNQLAAASPVQAAAGIANAGTVTATSLVEKTMPVPAVTLTFDGAGGYTRSDDAGSPLTVVPYTPGQTIYSDTGAPPNPAVGWSLVLQGTPQAGDTMAIGPATTNYAKRDGGNANALLGLRDASMFDGATLADGYSGLMAKIGVKVQGAKFSAEVSKSIATSLESDRAAVSGVNLDEEASKLLQYQQAYQASAKMVQIAQSIFDTLIQTLGR